MARSLTVQHEENVSTSPLLTGFLLFAFGWLILAAVVAMTSDVEAATSADPAAVVE